MNNRLKISLIIGLILSAFVKKFIFKIPIYVNADINPVVHESIKFALDVIVGAVFILFIYYIYPLFNKKKVS